MKAFEVYKKIDIGDLGVIYVMTWEEKSKSIKYNDQYFAVYFPKIQKHEYEITIEYFESPTGKDYVQSVLNDYINNLRSNTNDYMNNIFSNPEDTVFSVFEKLYNKKILIQEGDNNGNISEN